MRGLGLWGGCTLLLGCVFDPTGESAGDDGETGDEASTATSTAGSPTGNPSSDPSTSSASGTTQDSETVTGESTSPTSTDPTTTSDTDNPPTGACPDPLPEGWILCESFEDIDDPAAHFAVWAPAPPGDRFFIDGPEAHEGEASLVAQHDSTYFSGAAWIRFGEGPMVPPYAPDETFDEIWVRLHLQVEDGWDIGGFGDLIEVNSLGENWDHRMSASIEAPEGGDTLRALARSCISSGAVVCDGMMDWQSMSELGNDPGETPLFDGSASGEWHCMVMHVRLDQPGMNDGLLEISLDGAAEAVLDDLDFVGTYEGAGLNAILLSAYRDGGPPEPRRRYVDDIVVSEVPIECD